MRNSIKLGLVALLVAGFGASIYFHAPVNPSSQRALASLPASAIAETPGQSTVPQVTVYHFERKINAEIKEKVVRPLVAMDLRGTVWVSELARTVQSTTYQLQFSIKESKDPEQHVSRAPFVLEVAADQSIKRIQTDPHAQKSDEEDMNVMKDFASLFAYGSNRDTTGVYQFKLNRVQNQIEKVKLAYAAGIQKIDISDAKTRANVDQTSGMWISGSGHEQTQMEAFGTHSKLITRSSYKIVKLANQNLKPPVAIAASELADTTLAMAATSEVQVQSWLHLKAELSIIKGMARPARLRLFHELVKLLKTDPAALAEFKKYIELQGNKEGFMTFGIGVLATAGTAEAQATLREWYAGKFGVEHDVLNAFATASSPVTPDSRVFLNDIVAKRAADPDLAQNALFALGSSLKQGDDADSRKALQGYYSESKSESDRMNALDAIGNSGDSSFMPTLKQAMESGSEGEKERAVFAVRYFPAEAAAPILLNSYESASAGMKNASLRALAFQQTLAPHATLIRECAQAGNPTCTGLLAQLNP